MSTGSDAVSARRGCGDLCQSRCAAHLTKDDAADTDGLPLGQRPFDVAPDRNIAYEGALFDLERPRDDAWKGRVGRAVQDLTRRLKRAIESDQRTIGSPVYKELQAGCTE